MVEDTALSALLGLWLNKGLANSHSFTAVNPRHPQMFTGHLGSTSPPVQFPSGPWWSAGWSRPPRTTHSWKAEAAPSLRSVRVPLLGGGFISGNQEFLSTWCQKELCLFSHHWSLSYGSGGWGRRPSLVLGDVGAPCGLRCSFLASWLCHPESEWQAGGGDMHSVLNQGNLRIHLSQVCKGFAFV